MSIFLSGVSNHTIFLVMIYLCSSAQIFHIEKVKVALAAESFSRFFIKNVKEAPRGSSGKNNNLDRALVSPQRRIGRQRALVDDSFSASIFTLLRILAQHTPPRRQNSYFIKHARRHLI
jgi:hypothetical protein